MPLKNKKTTSTLKRTKSTGSIAVPSFIAQHEQALLVALAYVIGFTTAFIAFCLTDTTGQSYGVEANSAAVYANETPKVETFVRDGDLFVRQGDEEVTLSVMNTSSTEEDGMHHEIASAIVSPDSRFVYYCAQGTAESSTCANFIYDVDRGVIYRVKENDNQIMTDLSEANDSKWLDDGYLELSGYRSVSVDAPWEVNVD